MEYKSIMLMVIILNQCKVMVIGESTFPSSYGIIIEHLNTNHRHIWL